MAVKISCVFVCILITGALAVDNVDNSGFKLIAKVFEECSNSDGFSPCIKKKAITYLDRLSRMDKLPLTDDIIITRDSNEIIPPSDVTEEQLEESLPRSLEERDNKLSDILWDKVLSFLSTSSLEFASPKSYAIEEGRKKGGIGGGGKKGGMMGMLLMGAMGKMMGLIPLAIAGLFLLAGKALITSKIALLIAGVIALKKLIAAKHSGGHGGGHGGHHQVWSQPSGGDWDRRSFEGSQNLAYNAYTPSR